MFSKANRLSSLIDDIVLNTMIACRMARLHVLNKPVIGQCIMTARNLLKNDWSHFFFLRLLRKIIIK